MVDEERRYDEEHERKLVAARQGRQLVLKAYGRARGDFVAADKRVNDRVLDMVLARRQHREARRERRKRAALDSDAER